eukprot:TRINITY_DN598_c0_g1_i1.p2 TRINITY_DN598_c0_g1~~TRINITY_DN598_c0_g1_i1.p2  ORF type:complete len:979 (+),score=86.34 TRINITY_DN598_c0_g1_i1:10743-13679(+)
MRSSLEYKNAFALHGPCQIDVPYKGVGGIFLDEVLSPFYIFQIASIILWMCDTYYWYAGAILIMTVISVVAEIVETRRNLLNVRKMAMYQCNIKALRASESVSPKEASREGAKFFDLPSTSLVPGDIIEVPNGLKMPCDCVLLSGSAIVNEAMLTGESIPVLKTSLPYIHDMYNPDDDKKYTIYAGTEVIQARPTGDTKVCALVVRTGFTTIKGSLVRYILYPKPSKFSFYSDSYKFIAVMFCMSFVGMMTQLINGSDIETSAFIKKCLDLITITVPPALPAAMSIGTSFALSRLKKRQIFCISPPRVNMGGKIGVFCFDKTGTLTEEGLSVFGYRVSAMISESQSNFGRFHPTIKGFQPPTMYTDAETFETYKEKSKSLVVECLASCHSITRVEGKLIGDPLDIEMFNNTGWILDEPEAGDDFGEMISAFVMPNERQRNYDWTKDSEDSLKPYQLGIIRRFDFTSKLQRMSVIVQNLRDSKYRLFTKGSPEKILELSKPETIPANFMDVLSKYTQKGCRVLALATRPLNINYQQCQKVGRELVEKKLSFLGLLILQNKLKSVTPSVINKMQEAGIRTVMVTGDNAYTAISVSRECGMIMYNHAVFLGDLIEDSKKKYIKWLPIEKLEGMEDDDQPQAIEEVKDDEIEEEENEDEMVGSDTLEYIPRKISDSLELQLERTSRSLRRSNSTSSKERKKSVVSDEEEKDIAVDENCPWEETGEPYSLVFTGKAFDYLMRHDPKCAQEKTKELLQKAAVFARMSPDGKALLIDALQNQGHLVGMCGDGANDCVALKAADVGISLSEAEASIAAPFTSKIPDISCVMKVLREGRAALSTSFQCFKYMALYSMIQFTSVSLMYSMKINLTDMQFLFIDLIIIVPLAITMSWTKAASGLSKQQPTSSLICLPVLASILGQVVLQALFQVFLRSQRSCRLARTCMQDNSSGMTHQYTSQIQMTMILSKRSLKLTLYLLSQKNALR